MKPHQNPGVEKRFMLSLLFTGLIFFAELIGGLWTGSLSLLSDAAHVFMDVFALGLSFGALKLSALPADDRHTYGYHRFEVLAALANGATLAIISIGIFIEAWKRWQSPEPIKSMEMLVIAFIGLIINLIVAFVLGGHHHEHDHVHDVNEEQTAHLHEDVNLKSAFYHVIGDAISSVGVIVAAILIWSTGLRWIDPLMSVVIGIIILVSSWRVLKTSLHILVEGVPDGLSISQVSSTMIAISGVQDVHDLHVWNICSGHIALSAHVVLDDQPLLDSRLTMADIKDRLDKRFGIEHTTIQFECQTCGQDRDMTSCSRCD